MADLDIEDAGATTLECKVNGTTYFLDLAAAHDVVRAIDRKHASDPWACCACWKEFSVSADQLSQRHESVQASKASGDAWLASRHEIPCGHCGSREVTPPQQFLDSVSAALHARWGIPLLSRGGAWKFYDKILNAVDGLKKKSIGSPDSLTGSEASTLPAGEK